MPSEIGIDIGSYKTVICSSSSVLFEQPTVAAVDTYTLEPICFGDKAYAMTDKTPPSIEIVRPIVRGVVADYALTEKMLKFFMAEAFSNNIIKPKIMVAMPFGVTSVQHRSVAKALELSGGRDVRTVEAPLADAIALKLNFENPHGYFLIDIGAGTGRYSVALAQRGIAVTAVELVNHNLGMIKKNAREMLDENMSLEAFHGDARKLKRFRDGQFDITLLLGPMYHLHSFEDKLKALKEAKRVTRKGGYIFVGYVMADYAVIKHGFIEGEIAASVKKVRLTKTTELNPIRKSFTIM